MKKLWLVKREVWAPTIERAMKLPGKIYEISEVGNAMPTDAERNKKKLGFKSSNKKKPDEVSID